MFTLSFKENYKVRQVQLDYKKYMYGNNVYMFLKLEEKK